MSNGTVVVAAPVDGVAHVVLDRPEVRNVVNLAMCHALREAFERLGADEDTRAILLHGSGRMFCAGADLKERDGRSAAWIRQRRAASFAAYETIERCRKPVVALLHGPVLGSGAEIALSCDFAIGAAGVTFRFPEPHWGTVGATQRLQRAVGKQRAKELLYTNRELSTEEAVQLGLVTRIVPGEELIAEGERIAGRIASASPLAIMLTKQAIDLGAEVELNTGIRIEMAAIERNLADNGWRRGVEAFVQRHDDA